LNHNESISVFLIDGHRLVRQGIQLLLNGEPGIDVAGVADTGEEALEKIPECNAEVVLLDINLSETNGIEICKKIKTLYPKISIIGLSAIQDAHLVSLLLKHGACGYLLKNADKEELLLAIRTVKAGGRYLGLQNHDLMPVSSKCMHNELFPPLSNREKEVLKLIIDEFTTQEIADKLFISFATVESHRHNILLKLGARNTAGMVRIALEYELLSERLIQHQ
jgi:DNA-binding NarL/FixJ family response regulator